MNYEKFVSTKLTRVPPTGLEAVPELHAGLFPFQRELVGWALRRGRAALFASTGLGKSRMQLEWARHVPGDVLVLAPLAVAQQTAREGQSIGLDVTVCRDGSDVRPGVNVTNYDRIHRFDASRFAGVVLDESSIIKHHDAKTLRTLLDAFDRTPFKLCATATPAPNDYVELGTHAEFLGICSRAEMLAEYFCHDGGETQVWRLKGHARELYWRWVASWAALVRKPSDLGHDDVGYDLPPLHVHQHTIAADAETVKAAGVLFAQEASTLSERRDARRASIGQRVGQLVSVVTKGCERCGSQSTQPIDASGPQRTTPIDRSEQLKAKAKTPSNDAPTCAIEASDTSETTPSDLSAPPHTSECNRAERWVIWCDLNAEQDAIEKALGSECVSIYGSLDPDEKVARYERWTRGEVRCLVSKVSIFGFGLNMQSAARMAFVGVTDSWEAYHQAVRRCYRFGQTREVHVHVFASELEGAVIRNLQRKEADATRMAEELSAETRGAVQSEVHGLTRQTNDYAPRKAMRVPEWLISEEEGAA